MSPALDLASPDALIQLARQAAGSLEAGLVLARRLGTHLPLPGAGRTADLWEALADLGEGDLGVARIVEPHLDALAILAQAAQDHPRERPSPPPASEEGAVWGVYAAEGPGPALRARVEGSAWVLEGVKPWCSLARHLDRALVTAWVDETSRALFAVDLRAPGVHVSDAPWVSSGLPLIESGSVQFDVVQAQPLGAPGWYLTRSGFAWGAMGVAAIWLGGARGVAARLRRAAEVRAPDQIALAHLGACDATLAAATALLHRAASIVDGQATADTLRAEPVSPARLASQVRTVVAETAERVLTLTDHALGPGPLATEAEHARRVDDLRLYVRQWHAERDHAALGALLLADHGTRR